MCIRDRGKLVMVASGLMLLIILPVMALTVYFAWRYRAGSEAAEKDYAPEWSHSTKIELVVWVAPLLIIIALGAVTWVGTHLLDPYRKLDRIDAGRPIADSVEPLEVEVVALDWKWLFFLPEQGIATVNELAAPVNRPIRFKLTSSSTMNVFYVPDLAGRFTPCPGCRRS